jgi:hypothetical protein
MPTHGISPQTLRTTAQAANNPAKSPRAKTIRCMLSFRLEHITQDVSVTQVLLTLLALAITIKSETEHSGLPSRSLCVGKLGHRIFSNSTINGGRSWVTICQRMSKSMYRILHFGLLDDPLAEIWMPTGVSRKAPHLASRPFDSLPARPPEIKSKTDLS